MFFNRDRGLKAPTVKNHGIESSDLKFYVCILCFKSASDSLRKWLVYARIVLNSYFVLFVHCDFSFFFTFIFLFKFIAESILCMYLPLFLLHQVMSQSHCA